jgi:hypothetical protein
VTARGVLGRTGAWNAIAVGLLAIAWQLPYFDRWMSPMDEGHIAAYADLLAQGGELYRDATLLPLPGAFYLLEIAFRIFGPSLLLARWIVVFEFALLCLIAFLLLERLVPLAVAWAGVGAMLVYRIWAFPHWHMYSYSTTALLLLAAGLLALVRFLASGRRSALAAAGLLTGLGALCKQDYGAAGLVAMNGVLIVFAVSAPADSRPRLFRLLCWGNLPAAAVGAAVSLHFLRQGIFGEMLQQTVLDHLFGIATFEYTSMPKIWPLFEQDALLRSVIGRFVYMPSILVTLEWDRFSESFLYRETVLFELGLKLFFYAPYLIAIAGGIRLWWLRSRLREPALRRAYLAELALTLHAAALIAVLNRPVDWVHVVVLYWPFVCLLVLYACAALHGNRRATRIALAIGAVPAISLIGYSALLGWQLRAHCPEPLRMERAGIYATAAEARVMQAAVDYAVQHSEPGQAFPVLPYLTLISFLADRPAPHPSAYVFWPIEYYPTRQKEVIESIEAEHVNYMIYHFTQFPQFPRMDEFAPELFKYLVDTFEIDQVFSFSQFGYNMAGLRRSPRPPAGRPLVTTDSSNLKLWVETPGGAARSIPRRMWKRLFKTELWPFRPVLALRPSARGGRTVLAVPVEAAEGARLHTAIAANPAQMDAYPESSVTFTVRAVTGGERKMLYSRTLDPQRRLSDRGWFEVELPLGAFAEAPLELELTTECETESGAIFDMGGWEIPRLLAGGE